MKKIWDTTTSETALSNKWLKVIHDRYILPTKEEGDYFYVKTNGSSIVVPVMDDRKIVLVKQYRYINKKVCVELPMGGLEDNQLPLDAAKAELEQETGYVAEQFTKIGDFNPFTGVTNEVCNVYIARGLTKTTQQQDNTEDIEVLVKDPEEVDQLIKEGKIWDGQSITAWYLAQKYLKQK